MHRILERVRPCVLVAMLGCGASGAASPFAGVDAGADASSDAILGSDARGQSEPDGAALGGPCLEDKQCDDGLDCTFDACNLELGRCQFTPDDARCQNSVFCDGVERCDLQLGCRSRSVHDCNDTNTCTVDSCVEASQSCLHAPRDADGDGNPDGHCGPGGDCDDTDPTVYTGHPEICGNRKDDNCDGQVDEPPCQTPTHDTCRDPLLVGASGLYMLDTTGAAFDYSGSCAPTDAATRRDVVAAIVVAGDPEDVDVVAEVATGAVSVGLARDCTSASELSCGSGLAGPAANRLARIRVHGLPKGTYPLYVWTDRDEQIVLHVTKGAATLPPTNETCGLAIPLATGVPAVANLVGTAHDLTSRCTFAGGDLVYSIAVSEPRDVSIHATSIDGFGAPVLSLRRASCADVTDAGSGASDGGALATSLYSDEIACGLGAQANVFARSLPAGTYYVAVAASAPTDVQLELSTAPPTTPPADETCAGAPPLAFNHTIDLDLGDHVDDFDLACAPHGAVDAAYDLELDRASDVLLVERIASEDVGAVSLSLPACDAPSAQKVCATGRTSSVRASLRGVPPGSYRAVVESGHAGPVQLTAFVRGAVPPSLVPFADTCASPAIIPEGGGFFQGNTANAAADYNAGCDAEGGPPGGAPDQILKLVLSLPKRVVLDMQGSGYTTILDVRKGEACPGTEIPMGCSVNDGRVRSFVDLVLDPGTYWIQVDGYAGDAGPWFLDVRTVEP